MAITHHESLKTINTSGLLETTEQMLIWILVTSNITWLWLLAIKCDVSSFGEISWQKTSVRIRRTAVSASNRWLLILYTGADGACDGAPAVRRCSRGAQVATVQVVAVGMSMRSLRWCQGVHQLAPVQLVLFRPIPEIVEILPPPARSRCWLHGHKLQMLLPLMGRRARMVFVKTQCEPWRSRALEWKSSWLLCNLYPGARRGRYSAGTSLVRTSPSRASKVNESSPSLTK